MAEGGRELGRNNGSAPSSSIRLKESMMNCAGYAKRSEGKMTDVSFGGPSVVLQGLNAEHVRVACR